ncbi:MAG: TraR/DksA C4-type zinc finger protein [Desulfurivibrio sp.]|nr:TraR/DksA C4-type zinc finger protein [Desulfurivibrio sp.]
MREDLDLTYFKQILLARLAELTAGRQERDRDGQPVELDQARVGRLSRMDALQQQAMNQATSRLNQREYNRLKAALERLERDEYGYCLDCGDDIAEGRLRFDPGAPTCIDCAPAEADAVR